MNIHQRYHSQCAWDRLALNPDRRPALTVNSDPQCAACGEWLDYENAGMLNLCQMCWEHHCAVTMPDWLVLADHSQPYWQNAGC